MLKEIRIENFKSIRKQQIFTMEAAPTKEVSEYPSHIIHLNNDRLLKVSSIYGPNGSGKSNLISAIILIRFLGLSTGIANESPELKTYISSIFNKSNDIKIDVFFTNDKFELGYSITADLEGAIQSNAAFSLETGVVQTIIKKEELIFKKPGDSDFTKAFERDQSGMVTSNYLNNIDFIKGKNNLTSSTSFISYIVRTFNKTNDTGLLAPLFSLAKELFGIIPLNRSNSHHYHFNSEAKKIVEPFLPKIAKDLSKLDIRIKKLSFKQKNRFIDVFDLYVTRECKGETETELPISLESKGTQKMLFLLLDIYSYSDAHQGCLFLSDDMDAYLHPKLCRILINLFNSEENKTNQLILNSHDMYNMSNEVFRRDEIWFAERDEDYSTEYIPLTNITNYKGEQIRKDAVFSKQYLEGRFGADPFIEQGLKWEK